MRLNQEEDLEVAFQSGSITGTREVHLNGIDQRYVDPLLPDGDGLELIREVSVANPDALALVLSPPSSTRACTNRRWGPVRSRYWPRTAASKRSSTR